MTGEKRRKKFRRSQIAARIIALCACAAAPCFAEPPASEIGGPKPFALADPPPSSANQRDGGPNAHGHAHEDSPATVVKGPLEKPRTDAAVAPPKDSESAANDAAFEFHLGDAGMKLKAFPSWIWVFMAVFLGCWIALKTYVALIRKSDPTVKFTRWLLAGVVLVAVFLSFGFGASALRDRESSVSPAQDVPPAASAEDVHALADKCLSVAARSEPCCPPVVVTLPSGAAKASAETSNRGPQGSAPAPTRDSPPPAASPAADTKAKANEDRAEAKEPTAEVAKDYLPPEEVRRGAELSIPVSGLQDGSIRVIFTNVKGEFDSSSAKLDHGRVVVSLPHSLSAGRYRLTVMNGNRPPLDVPGELRVAPDEKLTPVIKQAPTTIYPTNGRYNFTIVAENLGDSRDTSVLIGSHDPIVAVSTPCDGRTRGPCLMVKRDSIDIFGFRSGAFEGSTHLSVRVVNNSSAPVELTFSMIGVNLARALAVVATTLIFIAVYFGVRQGVGWYRVGTTNYDPLRNFVLDRDTNSYSLSKLQVLLWTAASIFAYLYLFVCRILIQWRPDLPDVPDGLSALVGLSVGTTIVAGGITATRGPKGAGPHSPTLADFVSAGGIVVPERFQFLVWTLVGVMSFVGLVLATDPSQLAVLPTIPENFLALMGVSAAGYVAGKSIRTQGPVIHRVSPNMAGGRLALKIEGLNFEANPTVRIDQKEYPNTELSAVTKQSGANERYSALEWSSRWSAEFDAPKHLLEVVNSDGQTAAREFTLNKLDVKFMPSSPAVLLAGKEVQTLSVSVSGAVGALAAQWTAPDATTVVQAEVSEQDGGASIKLTPGTDLGVGQLAVSDEMGQRVNLKVQVRATELATTTPASAIQSPTPEETP